jgi:hypothetical protein
VFLAWGLACGPSAGDPGDSEQATSAPSPASSSDADPGADVSTAAASTGIEPGTTATSADTGDVTGVDASTGEPWVLVGGQTYVGIGCPDEVPLLFIELYPTDDDPSCLAPETIDVGSIIVLTLSGWDGAGGTFTIGPDGPVVAAYGLEDPASGVGTFTLSVDAPWSVVSADIELQGSGRPLEGAIDLASCNGARESDPCR